MRVGTYSAERSSVFSAAVVLLASYLCATNPSMVAQTAGTGALTGTVSDPSGGVVPGASVKVTSESSGAVRTVVAGSNGSYLVPLLQPGTYRVEVSSSGFKTAEYKDISIYITETATLNVLLAIGAPSETVVVQGTVTQLETSSSALGKITDPRMVNSLPLVTRKSPASFCSDPPIKLSPYNMFHEPRFK